jgi:pimeloyl-ACP methyl ester carboxylesterase
MKLRLRPVVSVLALLVLLSALLFLRSAWQPDRPVEELKGRWAPPPSTFLRLQDMDVHVRDEGPRDDPFPLVLLHGTSSSLHTWEGWAERLRDRYRVVRVDLPGFGLTGPPPDGDYTLERYAGFVLALLERLGIRIAVLGGNSFGGRVAIATSLADGYRTRALVLVDASGLEVEADSVPIGFRIAQLPGIGPLMANLLPRGMIGSSVRNVYGDPDKVGEQLIDRYFELTLREGNRRALVERMRQAPGGELEGRVADVRSPTLILWGGEDRLIPPAVGRRLAEQIRGSRILMFEGLGHVPQEEDPEATVAPVREFLGQLHAVEF